MAGKSDGYPSCGLDAGDQMKPLGEDIRHKMHKINKAADLCLLAMEDLTADEALKVIEMLRPLLQEESMKQYTQSSAIHNRSITLQNTPLNNPPDMVEIMKKI